MDSWYALSKVNNNVTIDINEDIGMFGVSASSFINEVQSQEADSLHLNMASLGGSLIDALAIYDFLKTFKGTTTGRYTGPSASSMTVIAAGLDKIEAGPNTPILVHNPWTMTMGSADELRKEADNLAKFENAIVNIYKKQTGQRASAIRNLMDEDKWIDAKEAKAFGLIDKIVEPENVQNISKTVMNKVKDKNFPDIPNKFQNLNNSKMENETKVENTDEKVLSVLDKFKALLTPKKEEKPAVTDEDIQAMADATTEQVEAAEQAKDEEITALNTKSEEAAQAAATEIEELKAKNAKLEAKGTVIDSGTEKLDKSKDEVPECSSLASNLFAKFQKINGLKN